PDANAYDGAAIGGHELYPLLAAGMECLVVPRPLGWSDIGTWKRLERVLSEHEASSIGPALQLESDDVLVASMDGRAIITLGATGLIVVTHEDAVYVLDKQKALDAGTLEHLRSLLAASAREDLL
ncbi:MAG TPA: hypothetical protein VGV65_01715, partial [Nocardioides sp.]|nr:hypothetical protein [Nocardioides sp.]